MKIREREKINKKQVIIKYLKIKKSQATKNKKKERQTKGKGKNKKIRQRQGYKIKDEKV